VPVPAAEPVVAAWRRGYDPVAPDVPAHITLVMPWLPVEAIGPDVLATLAGEVAATPGWDFALTRVAWFGERVLWLSPEPAEPFRRLTVRLAHLFGTPPWGGKFAEVVPHLTVARLPDAEVRSRLGHVEDSLRRALPLPARAEEVWVMSGDGLTWQVDARVPLAPRTRRAR